MSKPVRISDFLAEELQAIADRENRSLANLVQHLLTQALAMDHEPVTARSSPSVYVQTQSTTTPAVERSRTPDPHFKPDFK